MSLLNYLRHRVNLQKENPPTADTSGGAVAWANPLTLMQNVPCSIQYASTGTIMRYAQQMIRVDFTIFFDQDVGARINMRFVEPGSGRIFLVRGYSPDAETDTPGFWQRVWVADCEFQFGPG
jgi:hypothetical protein